MKKYYILGLSILVLNGCASTDYIKYTESQAKINIAKSMADAERWKSMAKIAESGDTATKVAAMFAMQNSNIQNQNVHIDAPKSGWDSAREWMGIIIPSAIQGYGIHANQQIATTNSNNSRDVAISTNSSFVGIAGKIQSSNTTNNTTDTHNIDNSINNSYNPNSSYNPNTVPTP